MRKRMLKSIIYSSLITLIVLSNLLTVFAVETYTWEEKASMSEGKFYLSTVSSEDKIYVVGGRPSALESNKLEMYDPLTDEWTIKSSMSLARHSCAAIYYNNKIYVFGGYREDNHYLNNVEIYDIETDTWESKANMPTGRYGCEAVAVGNKIYVFGGKNGSGNYEYALQTEVYDPASDTWEAMSDMPIGRVNFGLAKINNNVYLFGGLIPADSQTLTSSMDMYNTDTNSWETKTNLLVNRGWFEAVSVGDKIYAIGGYNNASSEYINDIEVYDSNLNEWSNTTQIYPEGVRSFGCSSIDNKIFITGGQRLSSSYSDKLIVMTVHEVTSIPTNLTATPANAQVTLNWDIVEGADTYTVKRATTQGGPYTTIAENITETSYIDTNVANGITYYYVVTAVNTAGESDISNEASATPIAPVVNKALLNIIMQNGLDKEYDVSMTEVENFISWYNSSSNNLYTINKSYNIGPFLNRKDYLVKDMIVCFEVMEYENIE